MHAVNVVTSAYGASLVQTHGQQHFIALAAAAGAAGIEIRRELFPTTPPELGPLADALTASPLNVVYSAPLELFGTDGQLDLASLELALAEAAELGASTLKLPLGHYGAVSDLAPLAQRLADSPIRLLVENDQTPHGGTLAPLVAFFTACRAEDVPVGMTFDIGNWHWTGTDPLAAAVALAPYVDYLHGKGVEARGGKLHAVPLSESDVGWRRLFAHFRADIPRAIEFPLIGDDLAALTVRYVALLAEPLAPNTVEALDVVTFGEAMAMFVADEPGDLAAATYFSRRLAGAETNFCVGMARLGYRVGWVSRLGQDAFGRFVRATLATEGIDCCGVATDPRYPTGFQLKSRAVDGSDPIVEYFRKGSAASQLSRADFDPTYFAAARHFHCTGVAPALSDGTWQFAQHALDFMRSAGKTISFDPNLRPSLWPSEAEMIRRINALAAKADWVLPGIAEGRLLTGCRTPEDIAAFYLAQGARLVVIKLGAEGAYYRSATEQGYVAAVLVDEVVDTVGAGDGFAAGVVSALLEGLPLAAAVARGNRVGAFAIQSVGDMEGLPTRAQLEAASPA
ncbi:PfkB family carbohydrate kinase [Pseudogulbenkiania subflava]|uniref:2-dehydro-3-deoxygluconokinase n=1 Tax=Pseudogulbenkiania subflava DSM 22618 TaxID=1123014 RepID=A0A1Y6CG65_9NEIS|nr:PfkB family carbohydrate kinase [Pseudogulbenkiania subflava]SMF51566.1 2-dehydro-3-deoxygluconokinase [Pseudogulbenkiania subflava DSM 22618]